jgi:WhiB family redox-sensing transcriptional regulator
MTYHPRNGVDEGFTYERGEVWQDRALCAQTDPEMFFQEKGASTRPAKSVCNGTPQTDDTPGTGPCPVRTECLEYALDRDERHGVYGGMSERERWHLKRDRGAA